MENRIWTDRRKGRVRTFGPFGSGAEWVRSKVVINLALSPPASPMPGPLVWATLCKRGIR